MEDIFLLVLPYKIFSNQGIFLTKIGMIYPLH